MSFELNQSADALFDKTKEIADKAHDKTQDFHENYVSKVIPDCGKYGDEARFIAEMAPGVSEYNAIRDGDWLAFAIAAGIDVTALTVGAFTAGAGYSAIKVGSMATKTAMKVATKEVAEASAKKVIKEAVEAGTKKAVKETAEAGAEKVVRELTEAGAEKVAKEVAEAGAEKTVKEVAEAGAKKTAKEVAEKVSLEVGEKIDKTLCPKYFKEIEKITNRKILREQRKLLDKALKERDFCKLSKEVLRISKKEFKVNRNRLIAEWEKHTGQTWPRYTEDVVNDAGVVLRKAGDQYDAHHIIELCTQGMNEWWNIHPAHIYEHKKIHSAESIASKIFGR